jgi:hypothetical protein
LIPEHLEFFHLHHYITFEEMLTEDEADCLAGAGREVIREKLRRFPSIPSLPDAADYFLAGRDAWRESPAIKKTVLNSRFAEIASELSRQSRLRIAYDQVLLTSPFPLDSKKNEKRRFNPCVFSPLMLTETNCIQGIVCALILQLSSIDHSLEPFTPLLQKKGDGIFFRASFPFSLAYLLEERAKAIHQLLIVYSAEKSIYKWEENDPHIYALKAFGYEFGDHLKQTTHPIVYS